MIKLNEAVIVEGKYDKIRLESVIDALIITTEGFAIFNNKEKQALIKNMAERRGILILTDSDSAGFMIRNFICGCIPKEKIKHAYIPEIIGKEKRKSAPSKEGTIGVEGMSSDVLEKALEKAGVLYSTADEKGRAITRSDLYDDGLIGGENSSQLRRQLLEKLSLPGKLSTTALIDVLNCVITYDEYRGLVSSLGHR